MKTSLIITFNPDIQLLQKNIKNLSKIMDTIVIIDNSSLNKGELIKIDHSHHNVEVILLDKNYGIAKATNIGFQHLSSVTDWVLVMDQDSILNIDDVDLLYSFTKNKIIDNIGMITPKYVERNQFKEYSDHESLDSWQIVDFPIASGSLVKVEAWKSVNGYDEELFIDRVDDDFDLRIRNLGYTIIQVKNARIEHTIGEIKTIKFFNKSIKVYNHNAFRKYYQARNNIIFTKKHGNTIDAWYRNTNLIIKTLLFENEKLDKLKNICKGIRDGIKYKL